MTKVDGIVELTEELVYPTAHGLAERASANKRDSACEKIDTTCLLAFEDDVILKLSSFHCVFD